VGEKKGKPLNPGPGQAARSSSQRAAERPCTIDVWVQPDNNGHRATGGPSARDAPPGSPLSSRQATAQQLPTRSAPVISTLLQMTCGPSHASSRKHSRNEWPTSKCCKAHANAESTVHACKTGPALQQQESSLPVEQGGRSPRMHATLVHRREASAKLRSLCSVKRSKQYDVFSFLFHFKKSW
jgi:hypothetical protein